MTTIYRKRYVSEKGIGETQKIITTINAIGRSLEQLTKTGFVLGYFVRSLYDKDTILDSILELEELLEFSKGKLPVIFVYIEYQVEQESEKEITKLEKNFDLKLFHSHALS